MRVPGCGPIPSRLMFIGDYPGYEECKRGIPWVGKAGKEFDRGLWNARLERHQVYMTNVLKTQPESKVPSAAEIERDEPALYQELQDARPETIVTLGAMSARWFLGDNFTLERDHAIPRETDIHNEHWGKVHHATVFPMCNPAAGLHIPTLQPLIAYDWQQLRAFLEGNYIPHSLDLFHGKEDYNVISGMEVFSFLETIGDKL